MKSLVRGTSAFFFAAAILFATMQPAAAAFSWYDWTDGYQLVKSGTNPALPSGQDIRNAFYAVNDGYKYFRMELYGSRNQDANGYANLYGFFVNSGTEKDFPLYSGPLGGTGKVDSYLNATVSPTFSALTFAKAYSQTALLVDADLKRQQVHQVLGFESEKGLGDYLQEGCAVSDLVVWPGIEKLTIISGGKRIDGSSELLGSAAMKALVADMKGRYPNRYVFFDVPPVLAGADTITFAPLVDHILFVVRAGRSSLEDVRKALQMLPKEKILGIVLNRQRDADASKYYYY